MISFYSKIKGLFKDQSFENDAHYLLSQELEFQYAKSIVTYSIAFIGGVITLKSALQIDRPIEDGLTFSIAAAVLSSILAFENQQSIIQDLRLKRAPSKIKAWYRKTAAPAILGASVGYAMEYFGVFAN